MLSFSFLEESRRQTDEAEDYMPAEDSSDGGWAKNRMEGRGVGWHALEQKSKREADNSETRVHMAAKTTLPEATQPALGT